MSQAKRKQLRGSFWIWRRVHGCKLGEFVRGRELGEKGGRAWWEGVRLRKKGKVFMKEERSFAREGMGCFNEQEEKQRRKSWNGKEGDRTAGILAGAKREEVVPEVRCRGLRL